MININARWRLTAAASVAAASLAGCSGGSGGTVPPPPVTPPPPAQTMDFSAFAGKAFAANANAAPASLDGVTFTFDVNDEPGAFDTLIMSGTFQ